MTIAANKILNKLPQFQNETVKIKHNQTVDDIIKAIKTTHKKFAVDYDKIAPYFLGKNVEQTCKNIFDFLRQNTKYFIESENKQSVKSPAAILKTKNIDCKNYALFTAGILDALDRAGLQNIDYCYRFVSSNILDDSPNHVFICAYDEDENEVWIDPIPEVLYFNHKLNFFYRTDKNIRYMPLYQISGIENDNSNDNQIGFVIPLGVNDVKNIANALTNLFGKQPPNVNQWKEWEKFDLQRNSPIGTTAKWYAVNDQESAKNEALNIISWIGQYGLQTVVGFDSFHNRNITLQDLANKLRRGGFPNEAEMFLKGANNVVKNIEPVKISNTDSIFNQILPQRENEYFSTNQQQPETRSAGMSTPLIVGAGLIAAYLILKKK